MTATRVIRIREDSAGDFAEAFLRLAEEISSIVCDEHALPATLMTVFREKAGVSGCCENLLDKVQQAVEQEQ